MHSVGQGIIKPCLLGPPKYNKGEFVDFSAGC